MQCVFFGVFQAQRVFLPGHGDGGGEAAMRAGLHAPGQGLETSLRLHAQLVRRLRAKVGTR